jgi:adenylate cyclase
VTALFTDVEGFTAMAHHIDPAIIVNTLDNYFEGMTTIIIAHGGMIDKIVGDAVHGLFNAPNDLKDHPRKAVECAIALHSWSEAFRHRPEVATIGFGRTRIGLETGPAIVGDVGIRAKPDYTAHGDAVNVAARLEAANKELGSSICIGPVAASRCDQSLLRPLGQIVVRGRGDAMTVFEPWSSNTPTSCKQGERAARPFDEDPVGTAACLDPC